MMRLQRLYNKKIVPDITSEETKDRITQNLALCTHAEISALVNAVNFKHHHSESQKINRDNILFESVDIIRYIMAIMNVWNINPSEFEDAFAKKDKYLWMQYRMDANKWEGQPVVIVDIDDVMAEFRSFFAGWLEEEYSVKMDVESNEYYFITALTESNLNPEEVFENFMAQGGFSSLPLVEDAKDFLFWLKSEGYWIQFLTARPKDDLRCLLDTHARIDANGLPYDRIDFSPEKFRWCAKSEYYDSDSIAFAIDDSPKHADEYAKHGIRVKVPIKSYNSHIEGENIQFYSSFGDLIKKIKEE